MQSICTLWFAIISTILAFAYYESAANLLVSRGYVASYAHMGCFAILFLLGFVLLKTVGGYIIGANIDLGSMAKLVSGIVCGLLCGIIFAGNLLIVIGMAPVQSSLLYSRFDPESPVSVNNPAKPVLNADGFVTGLFNMVSSGSMRSEHSFAVLHSNFISQNHLNRLKIKDEVLPVCGNESLFVPKGENLHPLRHWKTTDQDMVLVRAEIANKKIGDGGAANASGQVTFIPAQMRLIYSEGTKSSNNPFSGKAKVAYPTGIIQDGQFEKKDLSDVLNSESGEIINRKLVLDMAFELPQGAKPLLLEFKQGGIVDLTSYQIVERTEETERLLNNEDTEK